MGDFDKGNLSINNEDSGGMFYGFSYGNGGSARQDEDDETEAKTEELQPLNEAAVDNNNYDKMGDKVSPDSFGDNSEKDEKATKENKPCEDFEEILNLVGAEERFQKIMLYGVICPIVAVCPFLILNNIFMWDIPDHWCHVEGKGPDISVDDWKNLTVPR